MRGYVTTSFGNSVNRCANSVVSSFNALPSSPSGLVRYKSQGGNVLGPFNARLAAFLQRFTLSGNLGEPVAPARAISGVALTQLSDSRYLLFVLGKDTDKNGWLYVSNTTTPSASTVWSFLDYVAASEGSFSGTFREYQNVSFITER